jgi:NAD(P)H-dependent flavin oxidoreductase YrpB (nitropropane dioxygenase family)
MVSVPLVAKAVGIPVLAGGGIADGHGLVAALALGAHGVEIGTRFIAVKEAYAHQNYKDRIVTTRENDTVIVKRTIGTPGRALNNARARQVIAAENAGATREEVLGMVRAEANARGVIEGDMDDGLLWAGQSAALVDDIPTVAELMRRIVTEAQQRATGIMHMFKAG